MTALDRFVLPCVVALPLLGSCQKPTRCAAEGPRVEISGNHGHALEVPAADAKVGADRLYPVRGGDHQHALGVRAADFVELRRGARAELRTSSVSGHVHAVSLHCP
jgi:hypothetical protein